MNPPGAERGFTTPFLAGQLLKGQFGFRGGQVQIGWPSGEPSEVPITPDAQLAELVGRLERRGILCYSREILKDDDLTVAQAICPQLERFFLTSYGTPVAPGGRGRVYLDSLSSLR